MRLLNTKQSKIIFFTFFLLLATLISTEQTEALNISILSDEICAFNDTDVMLLVNITNQSLIHNVWFTININGTEFNQTGQPYIFFYRTIIKKENLSNGNIVTWQAFVNDTNGTIMNTSIQSFTVYEHTTLNITPANPNGNNEWYVTNPTITLTSDNNATNISYRWDSINEQNYTGPFSTEDGPNNQSFTGGITQLQYFAQFTQCNESVQTKNLSIDLTNTKITKLKPANHSTVYNQQSPKISALLDEVFQSNSGVNLSSVIMRVDGNIVNHSFSNVSVHIPGKRIVVIEHLPKHINGSHVYNSTTHPILNITNTSRNISYPILDTIVNYTATNLSDGLHNVSIVVKDNAGRNASLNWTFYLNSTAGFNMTVHSPQNGLYGTRRIPFNVSTSKEVEKIEYINHDDSRPKWRTLCKNCNTPKRIRNYRVNEGNNTITFRATDKGIVQEVNKTIFVDSKKPRITITRPKKKSATNGSLFLIKYTESNLENITLYIQNIPFVFNCTSGSRQTCSASINVSQWDGQEVVYYFEIWDPIRSVESRPTPITIDTTAPEIILNSPMPGSPQGNFVPFDLITSEKVLLQYIHTNDDNPKLRRLCNNCNSYQRSKKFPFQMQFVTFKATDKAGNSAEVNTNFIIT